MAAGPPFLSQVLELSELVCWLVRVHRRMRDEPAPSAEEMAPLNTRALSAYLLASSRTDDGAPLDHVADVLRDEAGAPHAARGSAADEHLEKLAHLPPTTRLPTAQRELTAALGECFSPVAEHVSAGFQLHTCTPLTTSEPSAEEVRPEPFGRARSASPAPP